MEKLAEILSPEIGGEGVPTTFKKALFWPGTPPKKSSAKARKPLKLPAVVSSHEWLAYEKKRKDQKDLEQKKKEESKQAIERNKKENSIKTVGGNAKGKGRKNTTMIETKTGFVKFVTKGTLQNS